MEIARTLLNHAAGHSWHALLGYIDPSTGSLIFQVAAASLISAGLFVKGLRDRMVWLFTAGWRNRTASTTAETENGVESSIETWTNDSVKNAA
jgi:hypothetical protein